MTDLYEVAAGTRESIDLQIRVTNTDDCRSGGTHWFTIAYSIQIVDDDPVAWEAVRAAMASDIDPPRGRQREEQLEAEQVNLTKGPENVEEIECEEDVWNNNMEFEGAYWDADLDAEAEME